MLEKIVYFSLGYCAVNWLIFAVSACFSIYEALRKERASRGGAGTGGTLENHALDIKDTANAAGDLAKAFKAAGVAPTAAALSLVGLVVAAIAAGLGKL